MGLAWTYTTFKDALRKWPKTNSTNLDYENAIDTIIGLGEIRVIRELNLEIFDVHDSSLTIDEGLRLVTKPTSLIATRSLRLGEVISPAVEVAADDDSVCVSQAVGFPSAAMALNGVAVLAGVAVFAVPRQVTAVETSDSGGGIKLTISGTDDDGNPVSEELITRADQVPVIGQIRWATVTGITGELGAPLRTVKIGGAVAVGALSVGKTWPLYLRAKAFCDFYAPDARRVGRPRFFHEYSTTQWELVDTADHDYAVISHHIARPASLSVSVPTTWLHTNVPDLIHSATLLETEQFLKADDRYQDIAKKYYGELIPIAVKELRNLMRQGDRGPFAPTMSAG